MQVGTRAERIQAAQTQRQGCENHTQDVVELVGAHVGISQWR